MYFIEYILKMFTTICNYIVYQTIIKNNYIMHLNHMIHYINQYEYIL